jgi:hypothetical protein
VTVSEQISRPNKTQMAVRSGRSYLRRQELNGRFQLTQQAISSKRTLSMLIRILRERARPSLPGASSDGKINEVIELKTANHPKVAQQISLKIVHLDRAVWIRYSPDNCLLGKYVRYSGFMAS